MELILNLIWGILAVAIVRLSICHAPVEGVKQRTRFAALLLLLLVLFPVISVTDDLQAMQNPAEIETTLRRVHAAVNPHFLVPAFAAVPQGAFSEIALDVVPGTVRAHFPVRSVDTPALTSIQNRPPPVA